MRLVEIRNLWFKYTDRWVLKNINLSVAEAEVIALFGPNGCGKTTLAKHLNGLLKPTRGTVIVDGIDTKETTTATLASIVGYVFQNPGHQIFSNTVFDEVAFGPRNLKMKNVKKIVKDSLRLLGLEKKINILPFMLSTGEKERLAIASVLAMNPKLLILDEPTIGQDPKNYRRITKLIRILKKRGKSVVLISHDVRMIKEASDKVCVMKEGRILEVGDPNGIC